jgi:ABC-type phosphate transport system substrate-binding protein
VQSGLKLTGPVIAEIFSGKITTWNNSAITALNPGVKLPSTSITVIHRSDSSGTTDGFTTYLTAVSPSLGEVDRRRQAGHLAGRYRCSEERWRRCRRQGDGRRGWLCRAGVRA